MTRIKRRKKEHNGKHMTYTNTAPTVVFFRNYSTDFFFMLVYFVGKENDGGDCEQCVSSLRFCVLRLHTTTYSTANNGPK